MTPRRVWIALALLWVAFFSWYTSFSGPLTDDEIAAYVAQLEAGGMESEQVAVMRELMEGDTGDDFAILNAIHMRDTPLQVEGVEPGEILARVAETLQKFREQCV